jgi:hypothetical protein
MTQYDAGPGDWSDRPWEDPERKPKPQARRRRVILPPWALLAILVALVILVCVSLVLIIRAIRGGGEQELPTPLPTVTAAESLPTATVTLLTPTSAITPTDTVVLPIDTPEPTRPPTDIGPGTLVIVQDTAGAGLNLREQPTVYARIVSNVEEGTVLTVLEGPSEADDYVWWRLRAPDGAEGWGAANWLALTTE